MADESTREFLLAEYENLRDMRLSQIAQGENRFNYFLLVVFGVAVALETIYSIDILQYQVKHLIGATLLMGTLLMGLTTLGRTLERNIDLMQIYRGMTRIRWYFVNSEPSISKHLILAINDDVPFYRSYSSGGLFRTGGVALMVIITNTVLSAVIIILTLSTVLTISFWMLLIISLGGIVSAFLLQIWYYDNQLNKAENEQGSNFPSLSSKETLNS